MSEKRYDRFRRLERPRVAGDGAASAPSGTDARIEAVEGPGAPAERGQAASGGDLERFRSPPERGLELDLPDEGAQPFLRCASCETDNFRTADRCTTCGADLDTEAVRQFNQRFWAARKAEAAAEAEAGAARRAALAEDQARDAATRREAAEAMAREVGEVERQRLDREGLGGAWSGAGTGGWSGGLGRPRVPLVFRLLLSLPFPWPVVAGLALLALPFLIYLVWPSAGLVIGAVLVVLCLPARRRTWSGSWFDR